MCSSRYNHQVSIEEIDHINILIILRCVAVQLVANLSGHSYKVVRKCSMSIKPLFQASTSLSAIKFVWKVQFQQFIDKHFSIACSKPFLMVHLNQECFSTQIWTFIVIVPWINIHANGSL